MHKFIQYVLTHAAVRSLWLRYGWGNRLRMSGRGHNVKLGATLCTRTTICIQGRDNVLTVGDGGRLDDLKIIMQGDSLRVHIGDGCWLRGKIKVEDHGSSVSVKAGTTMENAYLGAYEGTSISIGENCMFSDQVGLRSGDMHSILDAQTGHRLNPCQSITVEPQVWLCRGVTVLKGCRIGAGSVVGGFSVVTSSLPPGVLAVGSPAVVIREQIRWMRERVADVAKPGRVSAAGG